MHKLETVEPVQRVPEVAIFWDLENCSIPSGVTATEAIVRIRELLVCLGIGDLEIEKFIVYANTRLITIIPDEEAKLNNVTKIPVLTTGKDSADKRIIADMLLFALDTFNKSTPSCEVYPVLIVVSTDIDFFYSLQQLRERGAYTVVIHGASVHESVKESTDDQFDWYTLVRGIPMSQRQRRVDTNEIIEKLERVLNKMVLKDKLVITEKNVRAALKFDGKHNDESWAKISSVPTFKQLLHSAIELQGTIGCYDPTKASWNSFSIDVLISLYNVLLYNPGVKKNGKYPLALFFVSYLSERPIPVAQALEFIELSIGLGWIQKDGSSYFIKHALMQKFPFELIFSQNTVINPLFGQMSVPQMMNSHIKTPTLTPTPTPVHANVPVHVPAHNYTTQHHTNPQIQPQQQHHSSYSLLTPSTITQQNIPMYANTYTDSTYNTSQQPQYVPLMNTCVAIPLSREIDLDQAKAALQYYFQTELKSLPKYECRKSGQDHLPIFEVTVHVPLYGNSFFGYGKASLKKQSEKTAAKNACEQILRRCPGYEFPSNFYAC
jgi:hypothetical protein